MDRYEKAQQLILLADTTIDSDGAGRLASRATAHAVLALIDLITGDRETEIEQANQRIAYLEDENQELLRQRDLARLRVRELADQLDGCNDTLRRHEQAATNEAKQRETTINEAIDAKLKDI